jgi:exodeoxyribonuclease VII large subunit
MRVRLSTVRRRLETQRTELETAVQRGLVSRTAALERLTISLGRASETFLLRRRSHLERSQSSLQALSPTAILARGYALVFDAEGRLLKDAAQLKVGDQVTTRLGRGRFAAEVGEVTEGET